MACYLDGMSGSLTPVSLNDELLNRKELLFLVESYNHSPIIFPPFDLSFSFQLDAK